VFSGSRRNGPVFRDVQDRIHELADVLKAGNGVEASAARVANEELGAIREDGYGMGAERHVHAHAEGGIVVAQRLLKLLETGNRFPEQFRVKAPPRFHEALLGGIGVQVQHDFNDGVLNIDTSCGDSLVWGHRVTWQWLKGHAGHPDNERCDQLAAAEIVKVRRNYTPERLAALREAFIATDDPNRNQGNLL
jgi:hypothetical protein